MDNSFRLVRLALSPFYRYKKNVSQRVSPIVDHRRKVDHANLLMGFYTKKLVYDE